MTVRKNETTVFHIEDPIRSVKISNKDDNLLSQFGSINENDIPVLERLADLPPQNRSTPHQKILIDNHTDANKGKTKGYL